MVTPGRHGAGWAPTSPVPDTRRKAIRVDMVLTCRFGGEGPIIVAGYAFLMKKGCWPTPTASRCIADRRCPAPRHWAISASCSPIPIRRLKAPIAANCCAKHGAAFRPRPYARQRRRHDCARRRKCCRIFRRCASLSLRISAAIWTSALKATTTEARLHRPRGRDRLRSSCAAA